jgi:trehalose 6-phosphate synthase/phosphatase
MKLFIVSNRLPLRVERTEDGKFRFQRSEGGLATGLGSMNVSIEKHWIGWPGIYLESESERQEVRTQLEAMNFHPVFLTESQIENYYLGYSNSILWPLCHYFYAFVEYETQYWISYQEVNRIFAESVAGLVCSEDIVWVHDYQLMLLPRLIREKASTASIGYFHHIPFPSYELFRVLPERAEMLNGLLGADLIGFHTHDYMRHFISTAERVLELEFTLDKVMIDNRMAHVGTFPMGINYDLYNDAILNPAIQKRANDLRKNYGFRKLILSVDRLDYSKGIIHRLKGFAQFLKHHQEYCGQISMMMVLVPSRDSVGRYLELKTRVDETIGAINGSYSTLDWTPIHYVYHALEFEELAALYHIADIGLVTPLRDGMNLVAKEFVAAKRDSPGVLILSEMAGASIELSDAIILNPNSLDDIEKSIYAALEMKPEDQLESLRKMQDIISQKTVKAWAERFITELEQIGLRNEANDRKQLCNDRLEQLRKNYQKAQSRLFILDYDGTLAAFRKKPEDAYPDEEILDVLKRMSDDPINHVVVSSGRDMATLDKWLGHLPISMAAEHGAFYKENGVWHQKQRTTTWNDEILRIFYEFVDKTPQSRLEIKDTALVWHYRKVDAWLASLREQQLIQALVLPCSRMKLQIMRGNKIVEVKSPEFTKGAETKRLLKNQKYDFILAIGDDTTDEDTFLALPKSAYSVKVGGPNSAARYYLLSQKEVLPCLRFLLQ